MPVCTLVDQPDKYKKRLKPTVLTIRQITSILMLWLLTLFTAFTAVFADVTPLLYDIGNLTANVNNLDSLVTTFKHSLFKDIVPLIKLQNAAVDLGKEIESVTKDFNGTAQLNAQDTLKIAGPFAKLIAPLQQVLTDINTAKPQFDKAILDFLSASCIIKGHVVHLQQVTDSLIAQVKLTILPAFGGVVAPLQKQVDAAFNGTINGPYAKVKALYIPFKL